jgi:membrane protein YdbS with pleckstrin-like domain
MMQHDGMGRGMEWMHWGGALVWLLVLVVLVLAIAALVKYLREPGR